MRINRAVFFCFAILTTSTPVWAQPDSVLRVGAAKVDITPAADALPESYLGVNDLIYARAIVMDDGITRAALLTLDAGGIPTPLWQEVSVRLEDELSIPAGNLLLTATHTHSVPRSQQPDYVDKVIQSVSQAMQNLQPMQRSLSTNTIPSLLL